MPKLNGNVEGFVYITISMTVAVAVNNKPALRYVNVVMRVAMSSSLVHAGHYATPPKMLHSRRQESTVVDSLVDIFAITSRCVPNTT